MLTIEFLSDSPVFSQNSFVPLRFFSDDNHALHVFHVYQR
jgi:hypothetical protein